MTKTDYMDLSVQKCKKLQRDLNAVNQNAQPVSLRYDRNTNFVLICTMGWACATLYVFNILSEFYKHDRMLSEILWT